MITEAISKIVDKQDLTREEAFAVVDEIMQGQTTPVQTAAFLAALSTKSTKAETIDEITGCAEAMRALATPVEYGAPVLEIVGTGGDKAGSFNISTTAAFVIASAGVKVAKHGNRAASSKSGTADVQEALGANIHQNPRVAAQMLDDVGMTFFFAQDYHAAMKYVGPIRKELGIRTVFNILGPLTNPASPQYMVLGVYDASLVEPLARVLAGLGVERGMVVFGTAVLDELSTACDTVVCEFGPADAAAGPGAAAPADARVATEGGVRYAAYTLTPEALGFDRAQKADLVGGSAAENAEITRGILTGAITGAKRDTVVLNAGAALYVAGAAESIAAGAAQAAALIDNGAALATMESYIAKSNELAAAAGANA
jgi:anthranilate phosphoribosyltransferase